MVVASTLGKIREGISVEVGATEGGVGDEGDGFVDCGVGGPEAVVFVDVVDDGVVDGVDDGVVDEGVDGVVDGVVDDVVDGVVDRVVDLVVDGGVGVVDGVVDGGC